MMNNLFYFGQALAQQTAGTPKSPGVLDFLPMIAIMFVFMYFFFIRPQTKKARDHDNMMKALKVGDEVVTSSGFIGKVKSIADAFVTLELCAGTNVKVLKSSISGPTKEQVPAPAASK